MKKTINDLILSDERYTSCVIQKTYDSKKNSVALVTIDDKTRILKLFYPGFIKNMKNEYEILKKASSSINIPAVYEIDEKNHVLILQYIQGENLCDLINSDKISYSEKERLIILLADWYIDFHLYFKNNDTFIIRGDSILRNFIFSDRIWGLDFEESRTGEPEEDLSYICASILSTNPMFNEDKINLCQTFINRYEQNSTWEISEISKHINLALKQIMIRRDLKDEEIYDFNEFITNKN